MLQEENAHWLKGKRDNLVQLKNLPMHIHKTLNFMKSKFYTNPPYNTSVHIHMFSQMYVHLLKSFKVFRQKICKPKLLSGKQIAVLYLS